MKPLNILLSCKGLRLGFVWTYHWPNTGAFPWYVQSFSAGEGDLRERKCACSFTGKETEGLAVTILLQHPLRPRAKCSLCSLSMGAGNQLFLSLCSKRLWQRLWTASVPSGLWHSATTDATFPGSLLLQEKPVRHRRIMPQNISAGINKHLKLRVQTQLAFPLLL